MEQYLIEIIKKPVGESYLEKFLGQPFEGVVKLVVDIEKEIMAVGGELHSDGAEILIEQDSDSRNLWGGNFYPLLKDQEQKIELISLINIKPGLGNLDMKIQNFETAKRVRAIVEKLIYGE